MINSKYNKILTVILIIVVIVIFGLLGFWGYQTYQRYFQQRDLDKALNEFNETITGPIIGGGTVSNTENQSGNYTVIDNGVTNNGSGSSQSNVVTYKGFTVLGRMEIPKIDLDLPVLERATKNSLEQ